MHCCFPFIVIPIAHHFLVFNFFLLFQPLNFLISVLRITVPAALQLLSSFSKGDLKLEH